jgi:hypothetical protein
VTGDGLRTWPLFDQLRGMTGFEGLKASGTREQRGYGYN